MTRLFFHRLFSCLCLGAALCVPLCAAGADPAEYNQSVRVTPLLSATATTTGQPVEYPRTGKPEVKMLLVEIPPGAQTGWHKHPSPCYAYILSGSVTVEFEGGKTAAFHAGQAFAETVNTLHNGKNTGSEPVKIIMTVTGSEGIPVAVRVEKPIEPRGNEAAKKNG